MTIWWLVLLLAILGSTGIAFIWLIVRMGNGGGGSTQSAPESIQDLASKQAEGVFNDEFREELRNRGRLHFEKIIGENAMFLQQDLRLTTSQLNEYMKTEITAKLQDEFAKYEQSIMDAKQMAVESIQKTNIAIDEQREVLGQQVQKEIEAEKLQMVKRFEQNMTEIVNHYVLAAIGNQIDLNDQIDYIMADMEANKEALLQDITNGA
jgi:hypothetical protein